MASSSSSSKTPLKIGIVGFGPFAQFLVKTMIKQGHSIRATSRSDYTGLCNQLGVQFFREMSAFLQSENDVILLSTSILSFSQVLKSLPLNCLEQPTLFVDVLSVKEHPRQLMLNVLPQDSDLLCTHPMFGPESGKDGWKDLTFMFEKVRIRDEHTCHGFLQIFASEGCRMMEMTCEEHDGLSARSQFLTHTIGSGSRTNAYRHKGVSKARPSEGQHSKRQLRSIQWLVYSQQVCPRTADESRACARSSKAAAGEEDERGRESKCTMN